MIHAALYGAPNVRPRRPWASAGGFEVGGVGSWVRETIAREFETDPDRVEISDCSGMAFAPRGVEAVHIGDPPELVAWLLVQSSADWPEL